MSRLIDADKLIEDMSNKWDMQDLYLPIHFKELLIDEQPTAFDVDKVVEQLEKEIKENPYQSEYLAGLYKAIEIVKAGEV